MMISVQTKKWCVYSHVLFGETFYVGTGNCSRPFERSRRNHEWNAFIANTDAYEVHILLWTDDRSEALFLEAKLIREMKPRCNQLMNGYKNVERNRRISEVHKGKKVSEATRERISKATVGLPNNWLGRNHTEASKEKIRASRLCYPIRCVETGDVFPSISKAAIHLSISKASLRAHLCGKQRHVNGMTFEYTLPVSGARRSV